ncbi:hypothetical protein HYH03_013303 [Edaphochlamys debaryana]|uniref:Uncharacterized protein n=1 Tax=Edaphochlamys debaryana TaxID=47281 RepID=A0A835XR73_9CHLO|nr:hypothetical protein HYH03_013303 [Edaphochlamys debaryana]|eukprot:KAG2488160.1 hypothetical protein HYH03_013303 [Edaphochlamys debaryana]
MVEVAAGRDARAAEPGRQLAQREAELAAERKALQRERTRAEELEKELERLRKQLAPQPEAFSGARTAAAKGAARTTAGKGAARTAAAKGAARTAAAENVARTAAAKYAAAEAVARQLMPDVHTDASSDTYFLIAEKETGYPRTALTACLVVLDPVDPVFGSEHAFELSAGIDDLSSRLGLDADPLSFCSSLRLVDHTRAAVLAALQPLLDEGMSAEWLTRCELQSSRKEQSHFKYIGVPVLRVTRK